MAMLIAVALYGVIQSSQFSSPDTASGLRVEEVIIQTAAGQQHRFNMEVAEKPIDIQIGLMHRTDMADDAGMIFLMGKSPQMTSFWMKNTLIPLDMIFVAADGRIAHIHENAVPQDLTSISSRYPVTAVIEINGGLSAKLGIRVGDRVKYSYFK
jgi:hypothetical protein